MYAIDSSEGCDEDFTLGIVTSKCDGTATQGHSDDWQMRVCFYHASRLLDMVLFTSRPILDWSALQSIEAVAEVTKSGYNVAGRWSAQSIG
jgi:hypothetical protein